MSNLHEYEHLYERSNYVKLTFNLNTKRVRMPHKAYDLLVAKLKDKFPALDILLK